MTITWQGGTPPIVATLFPANGVPYKTALQSSGNGQQSAGIVIPFVQGRKFLVTLSDAGGFATGGTSQLLTVGSSQSGGNCNTADLSNDFFFALNSPLIQCQPYPITGYKGAVQPVNIAVVVPGGPSQVLVPPVSSSNAYDWTASLKAGTSVMFSMVDAQGRNGGSSDIRVVGSSSDSSCLGNAPPPPAPATISVAPATVVASTIVASAVPGTVISGSFIPGTVVSGTFVPGTATVTASATASSSASQSQSPTKSKGGMSTGAVVGIVGGVGLGVGILMFAFWWRRRKPNFDDLIWPVEQGGTDRPAETAAPNAQPISTGQYAPATFFQPPAQAAMGQAPPLGQYTPGQQMAYAYGQAAPPLASRPPSALVQQGVVQYPQQQQPQQPQISPTLSTFTQPNRYSTAGTDVYTAYTAGSEASLIPHSAAPTSSSGGKPSSMRDSRFVLHTDITESEGVVELPPQYSESRAPMPQNLMGNPGNVVSPPAGSG